MTRQDYELIKKLTPETLKELYNAIHEYECYSRDCKNCALSLGGICFCGILIRDKEVDVL